MRSYRLIDRVSVFTTRDPRSILERIKFFFSFAFFFSLIFFLFHVYIPVSDWQHQSEVNHSTYIYIWTVYDSSGHKRALEVYGCILCGINVGFFHTNYFSRQKTNCLGFYLNFLLQEKVYFLGFVFEMNHIHFDMKQYHSKRIHFMRSRGPDARVLAYISNNQSSILNWYNI